MRLLVLAALVLTGCRNKDDTAQETGLPVDSDIPAVTDTADTEPPPIDADQDGVTEDLDCDDDDPAVFPGADETCNGIDDDCDGLVDDDDPDVSGQGTFYADSDDDGFGTDAYSLEACELPDGYAEGAGDCDDDDPTSWPEAPELCDGLDNDCDGEADDDAEGTETWYVDADGDGHGDPANTVESCDGEGDLSAVGTDCDDTDADVNPGEVEVCNGVDDDCSGEADGDDAVDAPTWYADTDGDGHGDPDAPSLACEAPEGHVAGDADCDDGDPAVNPDAAETCNGVDDDCNGWTDDDDPGVTGTSTWWIDADSDGFGSSLYDADACEAPRGYVDNSDDCDDLSAGVNPDADETCSGQDDDCDGLVDTDDPDLTDPIVTFYADTDTDGFGDPDDSLEDCAEPSGYVTDDQDCDDTDPAVNPDAAEVCNGVDDDCDGTSDDGTAGTSTTCTAATCLAVLTDDPSALTGVYWLEPEAGQVLEALCDMDTDGGGWTLSFTKNSVDEDTYEDFASDYEDLGDLAIDPADASASSDPVGGWLDLNAFDYTDLQLRAYSGGAESYASADIARSDLRIDFGQYGYFLYGDANGYYWCGGDHAFTDSGSGQVNQPSGATSDCKGHGSLGSGWDFSTSATSYNQGLTLCGVDYSAWMHDDYYGTLTYYPVVGAAQAIWVR